MDLQTILKGQIKNHLLDNPIDRTKPDPYGDAAKFFGVDREKIRRVWRTLRKSGLVKDRVDISPTSTNYLYIESAKNTKAPSFTYTQTGDEATIERDTNEEVRSLEDLIRVCDIDTDEWEITNWACKKWDLGIKNAADTIETKKLFSVSAKLRRRKTDKDLGKQKNLLLDEIKDYVAASNSKRKYDVKPYDVDDCLLEISIPDIHFGKLSWGAESGEDFDLKIAVERYKAAVKDLISKAPLDAVDRILLPIGNDMITVDSRRNMTTAGTPQDSDSRFRKLLLTVKDLLIEVIDDLSVIAPVDVVVVSGNHDYDSMFTIGMVLEAFFHGNSRVNIDNTPTQRKYYQYHNTGIMFTHGNEEKHGDLGLIFATENTTLWAATAFREVQLGHYHKNKKINYVSVDEFQGFQIQILPSLSGTDFWHNSKGYNSLKQAKAFLYDKSDGKIAEFTFTVKK